MSQGPEQRFFAKLASSPRVNTKTVGPASGGPFEDIRSEGATLVGFDVWTGDCAGHLIIRGIRPIFQTVSGRIRGKVHGSSGPNPVVLEAKEGYAVAQVNIHSGDRIDGFELQYWRIAASSDGLDAAGAYKSDWVGGKGGGKARSPISGNGKPVVGVFGRSGSDLDRFGLIIGNTR